MSAHEQKSACFWREDIDSLAFKPARHEGLCVVHRRAFRTLLGFDPAPNDCCGYFENKQSIFESAALKKISTANINVIGNFHLNSRDIRQVFRASHTERFSGIDPV
jgi:hypothetical protein